MLGEKSIRLCVVEPLLEISVLKVLADAGKICAGRYLDPNEIPHELRSQTLLVTSALTTRTKPELLQRMGFSTVILIDEHSVSNLIEKITEPTPSKSERSHDRASGDNPLVLGVLPRVGVTTIQGLLEQEICEEIVVSRIRPRSVVNFIYCAEIDDFALARLFEQIVEDENPRTRIAVVINKIPETVAARRKLRALEQELRGVEVELVCPIFFDRGIQVSGVPSKQMIRAAQPLFDWIAKAN